MLTMDQIQDIRNRFFFKGQSISRIAKDMRLDWKTVQKYVDQTDFNKPNQTPDSEQKLCPKLEPYKPVIDRWLMEDRSAPRKQRHTAKRVFDRLTNEIDGFDCSYRTVVTYFSIKREEIFAANKDAALPLLHRPGEAQADFGTAEFYENGTKHIGKYLEVSYPHSNKGYMQLFYGENMECLLEGLSAIFRHVGSVPHEIWFDNTSTIVTKIIKGGARELTDRFSRFQEHYRFNAIFTNPGRGQEKGNVENKVGYQRRNFLVPVPRFLALSDYNTYLLQLCERDARRDHYRHNKTIEELFEEDKVNCHELPKITFDTSRIKSVTTNNWGKFYLNNRLHEYSSSPRHANCRINIKLTSDRVIVLDENYREVVCHKRLYGDYKQESMEWLAYLKQISVRPRALKYSGIYDMLPDSMQQFLGRCSNTEIGKVLKVLVELTERTGFDSALATVDNALCYGASDAESLKNLYRRLYTQVPELPPMKPQLGIPDISQMTASLSEYDCLLKVRG